MIGRALLVWAAIAAAAVANGAFRDTILVARMSETAARAVSTLMLSAIVLAAAWISVTWISAEPARDAWRIGAIWLAMTLAFETLAGHYLFRVPWSRIAEDYNLLQGRIWVLVLIVTLVAPAAAAAFRGRTS